MDVEDSPGARIEGNTLVRLTGGSSVVDQVGGDAQGIRLVDSRTPTLRRNVIGGVTGGPTGDDARRGQGFGVFAQAEAASDMNSYNDLIHDIDGRDAEGIRLQEHGGNIVNATIHGVTATSEAAAFGVRVLGNGGVDVINSIVDDVGIRAFVTEDGGRLDVCHCLWNTRGDEGLALGGAGGCDENLPPGDPLFEDPDGFIFSLEPNSPCVDAGGIVECVEEPLTSVDGGEPQCLIDLGHLGNTARAHPRPE